MTSTTPAPTEAVALAVQEYASLPRLKGRVALITGGNSGLGLASAIALASRGARVIMASRNTERGQRAADAIKNEVPYAEVDVRQLDLGSLESVHDFARGVSDSYNRVDILMNNAGLMIPAYGKTADGFELQIGTNHLGHFALTGQLLPLLLATPRSRIVVVGSSSYQLNGGRINFDDIQSEARYRPWRAYAQSKLANLLFMSELQRRLATAGAETMSLASQPGAASTNLQGSDRRSGATPTGSGLTASAVRQAKYQLHAATAPDAQGGHYYEPRFLLWGRVADARLNRWASDEAVARRLWTVSEELTGVHFAV